MGNAISNSPDANLNNITYTNVTEEYDPETDKWTMKSAFPIARAVNSVLGNQFITGSALQNKIYVAAASASGETPTFIYDPVKDSWSTTGKPVSHLNFEPFFSTTIGDNMYITNGDDFLKYIPQDNHWNVLHPFSIPRKGVCLSAHENKIYAIGGYNLSHVKDNNYTVTNSSDVEVYNNATSTWIKTFPLTVKRHSAAAVTFGDNLYVVGGAEKVANFSNVPLSALEVLPLK